MSRRLVAHSIELRHAAEVARKRSVNLREGTQKARTHGEARRAHANAARKRQDGR
jgi:hypothetical protein